MFLIILHIQYKKLSLHHILPVPKPDKHARCALVADHRKESGRADTGISVHNGKICNKVSTYGCTTSHLGLDRR